MVFLADMEGKTEIEIIVNMNAENVGNDHLSIGFQTEEDAEVLTAVIALFLLKNAYRKKIIAETAIP